MNNKKLDRLFLGFVDEKEKLISAKNIISDNTKKYYIGRDPNHDEKMGSGEIIKYDSGNNNFARRHAVIYFDENRFSGQNGGYWVIDHLTDAVDVETIIFEGNLRNQISVQKGKPEKLPLGNHFQVCGIFVGKNGSGELIKIDTGITSASLLDLDADEKKFNFELLSGTQTHWWNPNKMEYNGEKVTDHLNRINEMIFKELSKGSESQLISKKRLINSVPDWLPKEGEIDVYVIDHSNENNLKTAISNIKKTLEYINSKGTNKVEIVTKPKKGRYLKFTPE